MTDAYNPWCAPVVGCAAHDAYIIGCRDCLRAWLDRLPPQQCGAAYCDTCTWAAWFDGDEYLGNRGGPLEADVADATELRVVCAACRTR